MTFGSPAFFWASLALIPLAAVYLIRIRPRRQPVNTYFLWQRVFQEKAANSLFQRLRHLLSLLLLALTFLAATFALTQPRLDQNETPDLLILIDTSASMQTMEKGLTRLELAKTTAASWIKGLRGSQRAAIASVSDRLTYHSNLSNRARRLQDGLKAVAQTDIALSPRAFPELTLSGTRNGPSQSRILFLTDLQSQDMDLPPGIEIIRIGSEVPNLGITAADLRWKSPDEATLFVTVASTFSEPREVELEITPAANKDRIVRLFTMRIPAHGEASESIEIDSIRPGAWTLRANIKDGFNMDNSAPLGLSAPQPIPVQVQAANPFFYQQVIAAFSSADSLFSPVTGFARLSLAQGNPPPAESAVVFAPEGESPFWKNLGPEIPSGPPEILSPDHPLIARVDPALLEFSGARKLEAPQGSVVVLAHADGTPLLYTVSAAGSSAVVFNFDPAQGDFFLSPWFPVFIHDAAILLTGRNNSFPSCMPTGGSVEIPGTDATGSARFLKAGEPVDIPFHSSATLARTGHYTFTRNSIPWNVGAALLSPGESEKPSASIQTTTFQPTAGWPLSLWLLLAAILIALTEETLYHRRKVG